MEKKKGKMNKCELCRKDLEVIKKCGKCKNTVYCSVECQRKDWKNHKQNCESANDRAKPKSAGSAKPRQPTPNSQNEHFSGQDPLGFESQNLSQEELELRQKKMQVLGENLQIK